MEMSILLNEGKLRGFLTSRHSLKERGKEVLAEENWYQRVTWKFRNREKAREMGDIWENKIDYFSPLKFFKIYDCSREKYNIVRECLVYVHVYICQL